MNPVFYIIHTYIICSFICIISRTKKKKKRAQARINELNGRNSTPHIFSPPLTYRRNQLTEVRKIVCSILLITAVILSALYIRRYIGDCVVSFPKFGKKQASSSGGRLAGGPPVVQEQRDERAGADASGLAGGRPVHTVSTYVFLREPPPAQQQRTANNTYVLRAGCMLIRKPKPTGSIVAGNQEGNRSQVKSH